MGRPVLDRIIKVGECWTAVVITSPNKDGHRDPRKEDRYAEFTKADAIGRALAEHPDLTWTPEAFAQAAHDARDATLAVSTEELMLRNTVRAVKLVEGSIRGALKGRP